MLPSVMFGITRIRYWGGKRIGEIFFMSCPGLVGSLVYFYVLGYLLSGAIPSGNVSSHLRRARQFCLQPYWPRG